MLKAARAARVERFVWSSLDSAVTLTGGAIAVPHFDAKAAVAAHINIFRSEEMMREESDGWYAVLLVENGTTNRPVVPVGLLQT